MAEQRIHLGSVCVLVIMCCRSILYCRIRLLQSNGRPSLKTIMQQWNKSLQRQHGAGDVAKPKPLNLTPVSGADLLGPVEAPLPTPDKNSTVPGLVDPQNPAKKPIIEIIPPPSILTSGLKVAQPVNLKAGLLAAPALPAPGMPQDALPAPGQQLTIEGSQPAGQPGELLAIEGAPAPPGTSAEASPGTAPQVLGNELVPVTPPMEGAAPQVLGNELVPVTPPMNGPAPQALGNDLVPVSFPGSQVAFEGQLLDIAPQPMPSSFPPLGFQPGVPGSQLPPLSGGQPGQPSGLMGFEALGMAPFVAQAQPVADFSDLDGFKAMKASSSVPASQPLKPSTSGIGSQPLGDFFSGASAGFPASASASALMDLSPAPTTLMAPPLMNPSVAPPRAGTPPPSNGNNELISLT